MKRFGWVMVGLAAACGGEPAGEAETVADVVAEAETAADAEAEAGADAETGTGGDAEAETVADAEAETVADAEAETVAGPVPGALEGLPTLGETLCLAHPPQWTDVERQAAVERLLEAGVGTVRFDLRWAYTEKQPGTFDWSWIDASAEVYAGAGLELLGLLWAGNPWASSHPKADQFYPPDDPAEFGDFVEAAVTHLGDRAWRFEIWNEPNAGYRFWKGVPSGGIVSKGDPAAFGALLKEATARGRAACPDCEFAFGGPFFHDLGIDGHVTFLADAFAAHPDLGESFDAMGFHPYAMYPPLAAPEEGESELELPVWEMAAQVRAVMAAHGAGDRPLWTTEIGWPVWGETTPERQAVYLVRAHLHLVALAAAPVCWYELYDGPEPDGFPPEDAFGLLSHLDPATGLGGEPKPAFHALAQLGNRFAAHRPTRDLAAGGALPAGAFGYELRADGGDDVWWALWTHPAKALTAALPAPVAEARALTGEPLQALVGQTTATLGEAPIFLRLAP